MPDAFRSLLADLFAPLGGVSMRRMFGGVGVFRDGLMIALVTGDTLYFKADPATIPTFEAEGSEPFGYDTKTGRHVLTSYWRAPERLYDEPEDFLAFARAAVDCAVRADAKKPAAGARRSRAVEG